MKISFLLLLVFGFILCFNVENVICSSYIEDNEYGVNYELITSYSSWDCTGDVYMATIKAVSNCTDHHVSGGVVNSLDDLSLNELSETDRSKLCNNGQFIQCVEDISFMKEFPNRITKAKSGSVSHMDIDSIIDQRDGFPTGCVKLNGYPSVNSMAFTCIVGIQEVMIFEGQECDGKMVHHQILGKATEFGKYEHGILEHEWIMIECEQNIN